MIYRRNIYNTILIKTLKGYSDDELQRLEIITKAKKNATKDPYYRVYYTRKLNSIHQEQRNRETTKMQQSNQYEKEIVETKEEKNTSSKFEDLFEEIFSK